MGRAGLFFIVCLMSFVHVMGQETGRDWSRYSFYSLQPHNVAWDYPEDKFVVVTEGSYSYYSNAVPFTANSVLFFNGDIDSRFRSDVLSALKDNTTFEGDYHYGLSFHGYSKSLPLLGEGIYYVMWQQNTLTSARFTGDGVRLILLGNAQFEDDVADLSNMDFYKLQYNRLQLGIRKFIEKSSNRFEIGVGLAFLQGANNIDIKVEDASLYTAPDGEYLDFQYDMQVYQADTSTPLLSEFNGLGASADITLTYKKGDDYKVSFNVTDLGFINFFNQTFYYEKDTAVRYQGLEIPNIFTYQDTVLNDEIIDSLIDEFVPIIDHRSFNTLIPAVFDLSFSKNMDKWVLTPGLHYRLLPGYKPMGYLKANYFIQPEFVVSGIASYGGYSTYNIGLEVAKSFNGFNLILGSNAVQGYISPRKASGASLYLRLGYSF